MAVRRAIYAQDFCKNGKRRKNKQDWELCGCAGYINSFKAGKIAVQDFLKGKDDSNVSYTAGIQ